MKRIAIIGGGISGLSAAFALERRRRAGSQFEYVLFESSARLGGVILTDRVDGCLIEAGADSFLTEKPWVSELCRELGIGDELIGSNDAERKTYIVVKGKLVPIPEDLAFMVPTRILPVFFSPLFSFSTKLRMGREWFHPRLPVEAGESVASFVTRHYGREMVDRLADPLLAGIYGGEASNLSLPAVLPRFAEMQERHGSLGRAMAARQDPHLPKAGRYGAPSSLFTSLKEGMQQLVDAISRQLPAAFIRSNNSVKTLRLQNNRWSVSSGTMNESFDSVIVAVPVHAAPDLLNDDAPELASELRGIEYSSSVTVSLGFDQKVRAQLPPGFGFLVPQTEGKRILAGTFVHNKFPDRAPHTRALIRCFLGGTRDREISDLDEQEILRIVRKELREILNIDTEPLFYRLYKWKDAMAQYNVGHLERLGRIENLREQLPNLFLAGNTYGGIGVPDCVRSGTQAANSALTTRELAG